MARIVDPASYSPVPLAISLRVATGLATVAMVCVLAAVIAGAQQVAGGAPLLVEDLSWLMFTTG